MRSWVKDRNLSPISAKSLLAAYSLIGLCQFGEKSSLTRNTLFTIAGAGYRVKSRISSHSRRWRRHLNTRFQSYS